MKVYIVIGNYDYEGYTLPSAVFSKEADAKAFADAQEKDMDWCSYHVYVEEYEIDKELEKKK